ncbi:hypothetical protein CLOSYM_02719 [[Clostridium] symbiosum ATCC 14940]|uniref:Uncharacterized protein n=1 Tax=[Clostridium] symbiosum ATCC 14940 TaxID=411472 RepID=A0ABC9TWP5_CLOSY|nr:hypothetical protein CLOSYM_02719 [[Clostridium] symbiosum ATCC 14940]
MSNLFFQPAYHPAIVFLIDSMLSMFPVLFYHGQIKRAGVMSSFFI